MRVATSMLVAGSVALSAVQFGCKSPDRGTPEGGSLSNHHQKSGLRQDLPYPPLTAGTNVQTLHGRTLPDPYASLHSPDAGTTNWYAAQASLSSGVLTNLPLYRQMLSSVVAGSDLRGRSVPFARGSTFTWIERLPGESQSICWSTSGTNSTPFPFFDVKKLSPDGSLMLVSDPEAPNAVLSPDGTRALVCTVVNGAEDKEWRVVRVQTGEIIPGSVQNCMLSLAQWAPDGSSFYTSQYPAPGTNVNQSVVRCTLPTKAGEQIRVEKIYNRADKPDWNFDPFVSSDGRWEVIVEWPGASPNNGLVVRDLQAKKPAWHRIWPAEESSNTFVGSSGSTLYFVTDNQAAFGKLVAVGLRDPSKPQIRDLIPEEAGSRQKLDKAVQIGEHFLVQRLVDAHSTLTVYTLEGKKVRDIQLPSMGTVSGLRQGADTDRFYFDFDCPSIPQRIYWGDCASGETGVWYEPKGSPDLSAFKTTLRFARAADGTEIPVYVTAAGDVPLDGSRPTILYAYGGYGTSMSPQYDAACVAWLRAGLACSNSAVYAMACVRGGGEYGAEWHDAGSRAKKITSITDMRAAMDALSSWGYTNPSKLSIWGGSLGGLLVSSVGTLYPNSVATVIAQVPVTDLIADQTVSESETQVPELGSVKNEAEFLAMERISPYQVVLRQGDAQGYPAFLMTGGNNDPRVAAFHPGKLTAALQRDGRRPGGPYLFSFSFFEGHGYLAGDVHYRQAEAAAALAFAAENTGLRPPVR